MLAVEKIITSKLLKPGANKRIATVDRHVGIVRLSNPQAQRSEPFAVSRSFSPCYVLTSLMLYRYRPVLFPMVVTLSPEPETKHLHGEVYTKGLYRPQPSRIVSEAMYKLTLSTPVYDLSVLLRSSADGIVKQSWQLMARSAKDRNQALVGRLKVLGLAVLVYT